MTAAPLDATKTAGKPAANATGEAIAASEPTVNMRKQKRSKPTPFQIGSFIDGRYRLSKSLGEGGMAAVFLADDVLLRRKVALKQLDSAGPHAAAELELLPRPAAASRPPSA